QAGGRRRDPEVVFLVEVAAVKARIEQIGVAPGMPHVAGRIELDDRRRHAPGIQLALQDVLPVENDHMVLTIDANAAQPAKHPAVRQGPRPGRIDIVVRRATLPPGPGSSTHLSPRRQSGACADRRPEAGPPVPRRVPHTLTPAACFSRSSRPYAQGLARGAFHSPDDAGGCIIKVDLAADTRLGHGRNYRAAETASFGWLPPWAVVLDPADAELAVLQPPVDRDAAMIIRQRAILAGIGGKLVQRHADALRRGR